MHINKNFKLIDKNKYIIYSIIGVIFICAVVLFSLTTANFKYDNAISEFFFQGMKYDFFKGWTGYFVNDANCLIVSVLVPVFFILIEALYAYLKKNKPQSFGARHYQDKKWFYYSFYVIYPIFTILYISFYYLQDYGFGPGYDFYSLIGWKYLIPIVVVSIILNNVVFYLLTFYVKNEIARRENFLESEIWKRAFVAILFTGLIYLVVMIIKGGIGRPYWFNLHWHEYLHDYIGKDQKRLNHYMNQKEINWGWMGNGKLDEDFPPDLQDWPWYKIAHGFFKPNPEYCNTPWADAFPSGHMGMASVIAVCLWFVYFKDSDNKSRRIMKWLMIGLVLVYWLNLFFCLLISLGHWASDLSFTLMYAPIAFIISNLIVNGIVKAIRK